MVKLRCPNTWGIYGSCRMKSSRDSYLIPFKKNKTNEDHINLVTKATVFKQLRQLKETTILYYWGFIEYLTNEDLHQNKSFIRNA